MANLTDWIGVIVDQFGMVFGSRLGDLFRTLGLIFYGLTDKLGSLGTDLGSAIKGLIG
jgi:hypothetical protein